MARNQSLERLIRRMARIPAAARAEANKVLAEQAIDLGSKMKSVVPVDDGALKESVRYQPQELRVFVKAGGEKTTRPVRNGSSATYDYALAQEFGTANHPAQPFFWPTYRLMKKGIRSAINKSIKRGIEKAYGGGS